MIGKTNPRKTDVKQHWHESRDWTWKTSNGAGQNRLQITAGVRGFADGDLFRGAGGHHSAAAFITLRTVLITCQRSPEIAVE